MSGVKDVRTRLQAVYFTVLQLSTFNAMGFDENPFTYRCEREKEQAQGFQISHFYWPFSFSDIVAVKGLITEVAYLDSPRPCLRRCVRTRALIG